MNKRTKFNQSANHPITTPTEQWSRPHQDTLLIQTSAPSSSQANIFLPNINSLTYDDNQFNSMCAFANKNIKPSCLLNSDTTTSNNQSETKTQTNNLLGNTGNTIATNITTTLLQLQQTILQQTTQKQLMPMSQKPNALK